jgi:hypothetical protein
LKWVLASSLVAVAACVNGSAGPTGHDSGTGPTPDKPAAVDPNGSRLEAQYFVGSDGSKAYAGMYDTETKQDCAFVMAADGTYRCLPSGPSVIASTAYYADPTCTQPILNVARSCTAPPYMSTFETKCGGTTVFHVFPTSAVFAPGASVYLSAGGGAACNPILATATVGTWIGAGKEALPSSFVQGNLEGE